jgi:hypothetical protein
LLFLGCSEKYITGEDFAGSISHAQYKRVHERVSLSFFYSFFLTSTTYSEFELFCQHFLIDIEFDKIQNLNLNMFPRPGGGSTSSCILNIFFGSYYEITGGGMFPDESHENRDSFALNMPDESHEKSLSPQVECLMRCHFIHAIVLVAHSLYISSGTLFDISFAIDCLISDHILPRLTTIANWSAHRDTFRARHFYTRDVDKVLQGSLETLQLLFAHFSKSVSDESIYKTQRRIKDVDVSLLRTLRTRNEDKNESHKNSQKMFHTAEDLPKVHLSGWSFLLLHIFSALRFMCCM